MFFKKLFSYINGSWCNTYCELTGWAKINSECHWLGTKGAGSDQEFRKGVLLNKIPGARLGCPTVGWSCRTWLL